MRPKQNSDTTITAASTTNSSGASSVSRIPTCSSFGSRMSVIGTAHPDVVRIKVYKPNSVNGESESKKFCVDPRLTSYNTLQCLIAQAFDIKTDFVINAIVKDSYGRETITAIWSDWDLDAAFQNVIQESCLKLRYELTHREDGLDDWDFIHIGDFGSNIRWFSVDSRSIIATVNQTAGKAASALNKAINWMYGVNGRRNIQPLGEGDLKKFLDCEGRLIHNIELRQAIFDGGIEPSFRKVVWRHLLNIFPSSMTGTERIEYLKSVNIQYEKLKMRWAHEHESCQEKTETIRLIMQTVRKDALRTDRAFGFYAGSDNNVNVQSLFNILTTYCVNHPSITYCQGMNDYASTLLYVMREEALTYICFCSIMKRIRANFATDGVAIATKFHHLKVLFQAVDPVYWDYFCTADAVNLLFVYRWLLLECKREFPFSDALRVLEVMWSTLPIDNEPPSLSEIPLLATLDSNEKLCFTCASTRPDCSVRRAISCPDLYLSTEPIVQPMDHYLSRFDNSTEPLFLSSSWPSITRSTNEYCGRHIKRSSTDDYSYYFMSSSQPHSSQYQQQQQQQQRQRSLENSFSVSELSEFDCDAANQPIAATAAQISWITRLPPCNMWLDEDNPFLLFLCISIMLTHRTYLLKQNNLDEQDIAMYFDRYRRRHHADRILNCTRTLYSQYIQWSRKKRMIDDLSQFSAS